MTCADGGPSVAPAVREAAVLPRVDAAPNAGWAGARSPRVPCAPAFAPKLEVAPDAG